MTIKKFRGKKVLITAGPTREAIDPVRYISNYSSGKMGYAIAEKLLKEGAEVILISGPVSIALNHANLLTIKIESAADMYLACCQYFEEMDIVIFAAAVADYRPEKIAVEKIKKDDDYFSISMVKNIDIAAEFGKIKNAKQLSIGFALETTDELKHAIAKLTRKNFDMVILNSMNDAHATFGYDTNKIIIIKKNLSHHHYPLKTKMDVAGDIVKEIEKLLKHELSLPQRKETGRIA